MISFFLEPNSASKLYRGISLSDVLLQVLEAIGGQEKVGPRSKGPLKRLAQKLLSDHWQKKGSK